MEILPFLLMPFLASLILTGIHAYLGVHVVERGVIFVDLALAQIAALGATIAILVGMDPHGRGSYWISLGFTFLGAAIFAMARTRRGHIPQEIPGHLHESRKSGGNGNQRPPLGLPLLRFVWLRGHVFGGDSRCVAGVLLPDRAFGGRHALCRPHRCAPRARLDHGRAGLRPGRLSLRAARSADRRDDRLHVRKRADSDVLPPLDCPSWARRAGVGGGASRATRARQRARARRPPLTLPRGDIFTSHFFPSISSRRKFGCYHADRMELAPSACRSSLGGVGQPAPTLNEMAVPHYTTDDKLIPRPASRFWVKDIGAPIVVWRDFPTFQWIPVFFVRHIRLETLAAGVYAVLRRTVVYL